MEAVALDLDNRQVGVRERLRRVRTRFPAPCPCGTRATRPRMMEMASGTKWLVGGDYPATVQSQGSRLAIARRPWNVSSCG